MIGIMVSAVVLISMSYMAARMFTGLVKTPPTPLSFLEDEPREVATVAGARFLQMRLSPRGDFLAALVLLGESETRIFLYRLEGEALTLLRDFPVKGYRLDWREEGGRPLLVYEDAGDIWQIDPEKGEPLNLTPGDPAFFDGDPRPSPDGIDLLFSRTPLQGPGRPQLWSMKMPSGEARYLAPWNGEPLWDPGGSRIAILYPLSETAAEGRPGYQVELLELQGEGRQLMTLRGRQVLYLGWAGEDELLLVSVYRPEDGSEPRGVAYRREARARGEEEAIGTLRSIGDDGNDHRFCLDRRGKRLAYLGSGGLEFFDLEERRVYRQERVSSFDALDWLPDARGVVFARDGIIYLLYLER